MSIVGVRHAPTAAICGTRQGLCAHGKSALREVAFLYPGRSTQTQREEETADFYAFALSQAGVDIK